MTLICFIFLLLMHRFFKNSCLNVSYLCWDDREPKTVPSFHRQENNNFHLRPPERWYRLSTADQLSGTKTQSWHKTSKDLNRLKWLSQRVPCSPAWRLCTTWLTSCQESILSTNYDERAHSVAESSANNNGVVMPKYQLYIVVRQERCLWPVILTSLNHLSCKVY